MVVVAVFPLRSVIVNVASPVTGLIEISIVYSVFTASANPMDFSVYTPVGLAAVPVPSDTTVLIDTSPRGWLYRKATAARSSEDVARFAQLLSVSFGVGEI